MSEETKELEAGFRRREEALASFYAADTLTMSEEEAASLTPILNSLQHHTDRYEELSKLGEGGEKRITLVYDRQLDRQVAMARSVRDQTPQELEQFLREARLTANLSHPNIMPIYNLGLDEASTPFFTMELIPGDSLLTIIKKLQEGDPAYKQFYPRENLLNLFLKVCDAIAYAHSRNVLHLDIKPDNIRVGHFGEVLVCDWGLARVVVRSAETAHLESDALDADVLNDMTLSGTLKGTPGFMAPEQTMAYSEKTEQTDIYALGAVLYMLLTLELPVKGKSANEVVQNTREGNVIPPRKRRKERRVPVGLEAVILKALALKPEERYDSVKMLRKEISRFLAGHPTKAEHAGVMTMLSLLMQRHSRISFLMVIFVTSLTVLVGFNSLSMSREKAEAVAARNRAERNYRMYAEQQEVTKQLGKELNDVVNYTIKSRDFINAAAMIPLLESGLQQEGLDPIKEQNLLIQKGTLHFVLQQFNAAAECFEIAGDSRKVADLLALSLKYAEVKPRDHRRLNDRELATLFYDAKFDGLRSTLYYMYYHHMRRKGGRKPEEYSCLASTMLDKLNAIKRYRNLFILEDRLTQDEQGRYHLNLRGVPYTTYMIDLVGVYRRNILQPLNLYALDLSGSPLTRLSEFRGMGFVELKLLHYPLPGVKMMSKEVQNMKIKRLYIDAGVYSKKELQQLRALCEVIEVAP